MFFFQSFQILNVIFELSFIQEYFTKKNSTKVNYFSHNIIYMIRH